MKASYLLRIILSISFICITGNYRVHAADESYIETITGDIHQNSTVTVTDDKFLNLPLLQWNEIQNLKVDNIISFELRRDVNIYYYDQPFTCTLNVSIEYWT